MDNKIAVLFSGGWESTYCLIKAIRKHGVDNVTTIYVHYGAPFQKEEYDAAMEIAYYLGINNFETVYLAGTTEAVKGIFKGRNTLMFTTIITEFPDIETVYFGCRNILSILDKYGDSNWQYGKCMSKALQLDIVMPCIMLPKFIEESYILEYSQAAYSTVFSTEGMS